MYKIHEVHNDERRKKKDELCNPKRTLGVQSFFTSISISVSCYKIERTTKLVKRYYKMHWYQV
jgi:hypothetical protein